MALGAAWQRVKSLMTRTLWPVAVLVLLGCSHGGFQAPPGSDSGGEYFSMRTEDGVAEARVSRSEVSGADIQLTRYESSLRGRAFGRSVELYWSEDQVRGSVTPTDGQTRPIDLIVEQEDDLIEIRGLYAGRQGTMTIKPGVLEGTMGACTYGLRSDGGAYFGQTTCGGVPVQTVVSLPPILVTLPPVEIAAYLAVFLGR